MKRSIKAYATIAFLGSLTGFTPVLVCIASEKILHYNRPWDHPWLVVPLSAPFGILIAMIVRHATRAYDNSRGLRTLAIVVAWSIVAFVLAAGCSDFLLSDDDTPEDLDYAVSGAVGGLMGSAIIALAIRSLLRRRGIPFSWWPMVVAGTFIGAFWPESAFFVRFPPDISCLLFPLWQACVVTALWFGLREAASSRGGEPVIHA